MAFLVFLGIILLIIVISNLKAILEFIGQVIGVAIIGGIFVGLIYAVVFGVQALAGTPFLLRFGLFANPYYSLLAWLAISLGLFFTGLLILYMLKPIYLAIKYLTRIAIDLLRSTLSFVWLLFRYESRFIDTFNNISLPIFQSAVIRILSLFKRDSPLKILSHTSLSRRLEIDQKPNNSFEEYLDYFKNIKWTFRESEVFHQIFCYSNRSHKLYLIIEGLGFNKKRYAPEPHCSIAEDYIHNTRDANRLRINEVQDKFVEYWEIALSSRINRNFTLAYMLNRNKFRNFKSKLTVTPNPGNTSDNIKKEFSLKKLHAQSKGEVEILLEKEKIELQKVYYSDLFVDCAEYLEDIKPIRYGFLYGKSFGKNKRINLSALTKDNRVSFDFNKDTTKIEEDLKEQLVSLTDSDSIMKAKNIASRNVENLVDWLRLGYSLETNCVNSINYEKTNNAVAIAFKSNNHHLAKAALSYIIKSNDPRWINLLPSYSGSSRLDPMIAKAVSNKASIRALQFIAKTNLGRAWEKVLDGNFSSAVFSEDGKLAYANGSIYELHDWVTLYQLDDFIDFAAGGQIILFRGNIKRPYSKKKGLRDDSRTLLSVSQDGKWFTDRKSVYHLTRNKHIASIESPIKVFSPDNKWMATHDAIYSTKNWKIYYKLDTKDMRYPYEYVAVFSPDSKWFSNGQQLIWINKKRFWNYKGVNPCFSSDGKWYADSERLINLDLRKKGKRYYLDNRYTIKGSSFGFSNDSCLYACDKILYQLNPTDNGSINNDNIPSTFQSFSNDSMYLATANEIIWIKNMKTITQLNAKNARFSPDGYFIACSDGLYLTNKHQLLLFETAINSLIDIKENLDSINITELIKLKKHLSSNKYFKGFLPQINEILEQKGENGHDISIDKSNRNKSTDISIGE